MIIVVEIVADETRHLAGQIKNKLTYRLNGEKEEL